MNSRVSLLKITRPAVRASWLSTQAKSVYPTIELTVRDNAQSGSRRSQKLREARLIPGVIYGVDENRNIVKSMFTVKQKDLMRELRQNKQSFENTIYEVTLVRTVDGAEPVPVEGSKELMQPTEVVAKFLAAPRQAQFNPVSDLPVAVNFLRYWPGVTRLRIPVEFINEESSQDMKRGCFLVRVNEFVECVCDGDVPSKIVVDLSEAKKGDVIRLNSVKLPPQVRPAKKVAFDFVLGVVQSARG